MLQGKELMKKADKAILMYSEVFDALEEYDRTKRLRKINYKTRVNFTIDSNLMREFRAYCNKKGIKMSSKVEELVKEELKE